MRLRLWQTRCINQALSVYKSGQRHFLSVATPGAGKTVMASALAKRLFQDDLIDLVICLTPSQVVKASFIQDLSTVTGRSMSGGLGSHGRVLTYQALGHLQHHFWELFNRFRIFVIFDEIHHCGGAADKPGNSWGESILSQLHDKAQYTLSLSGTPWRSDELPVVFANYVRPIGTLKPDFIYSLQEAIDDGVCRIPQIIVIDNNGIELKRSGDENNLPIVYHGIQHLFSEEDIPYQTLLENDSLLAHVLLRAIKQLAKIQRTSSAAAGLIVASTVEHAQAIYEYLTNVYGQSAILVTHKTLNATEVLKDFNKSKDNWIVSVGMVSEGTNIPRLQVCCHLSRVKTELHFRQVLGRILRATNQHNEHAYMFILADTRLVQYARRVADDLPNEATVVDFEPGPRPAEFNEDANEQEPRLPDTLDELPIDNSPFSVEWSQGMSESTTTNCSDLSSTISNRISISLFGKFMEELIALQAGFRASNCTANPLYNDID